MRRRDKVVVRVFLATVAFVIVAQNAAAQLAPETDGAELQPCTAPALGGPPQPKDTFIKRKEDGRLFLQSQLEEEIAGPKRPTSMGLNTTWRSRRGRKSSALDQAHEATKQVIGKKLSEKHNNIGSNGASIDDGKTIRYFRVRHSIIQEFFGTFEKLPEPTCPRS